MQLQIQLFSKATESARITGLAAIPRVSLNGRLYLPEELAKLDGKELPLLYRHSGTPSKLNESIPDNSQIGKIKLNWDWSKLQLNYDAIVDEKYKHLIEGAVGVSISGFYKPKHICGSKLCYEVVTDFKPDEVSLVPNPGIPETTIKLVESAPAVQRCRLKRKSPNSED